MMICEDYRPNAGGNRRCLPPVSSGCTPGADCSNRLGDSSVATERAYFDQHAIESGDFNPFTERGWQTLKRALIRLGPSPPDADLLDVGCGTGHSYRVYEGTCRSYVGIDLSLESVKRASYVHSGLRWASADACQLPFADHSFDVVAFSSVLHHIPDYQPALREGWRVLRPGGHVLAFDPNLYHPAMFLLRNPGSPFYLPQGVSPNERPLRPVELRRAFAAVGFQRIRQQCQAGIAYRHTAVRAINALLSLYNWADWAMEASGVARWFGTFVVTVGYRPKA